MLPVRMKIILNVMLAASAAAIFICGCSQKSSGDFQGYVEGEYVYIASPLAGTLANLAIAHGSSVTNGQLLFELERGSEKSALDSAEKNLQQAKGSLELAEATLKRRRSEEH